MSYNTSNDNEQGRRRTECDDSTYGFSKSGIFRGVPGGRGRRRSIDPPGPTTTLEMLSKEIEFVKRGVDHETALEGQALSQPSPLQPEPGNSFTDVNGYADQLEHDVNEVLDALAPLMVRTRRVDRRSSSGCPALLWRPRYDDNSSREDGRELVKNVIVSHTGHLAAVQIGDIVPGLLSVDTAVGIR